MKLFMMTAPYVRGGDHALVFADTEEEAVKFMLEYSLYRGYSEDIVIDMIKETIIEIKIKKGYLGECYVPGFWAEDEN